MLSINKMNRPDINKVINSEWFTEKSLDAHINLQNYKNLISMEISFVEQGEQEEKQEKPTIELTPISKHKNDDENVSEFSPNFFQNIQNPKSTKLDEEANPDEKNDEQDENLKEATNTEDNRPKKVRSKPPSLKLKSFRQPNSIDLNNLKTANNEQPNPDKDKENDYERDIKRESPIKIVENLEGDLSTSKSLFSSAQKKDENPSNKKINRPKTILKMRSLIEEAETLRTDESTGSKINIPNHDILQFAKSNELKHKTNRSDPTEEKELMNLAKNQDKNSGIFLPNPQNERKISNNGTNSNHSSPRNIKEGKTNKKVLKFADEIAITNEKEVDTSMKNEKKRDIVNNLFDVYNMETPKMEDIQKELERESLDFFARLSEKITLFDEQEDANKETLNEREIILETEVKANKEEHQQERTDVRKEKKSDLNDKTRRSSESNRKEKTDSVMFDRRASGDKVEEENNKQTSNSKMTLLNKNLKPTKVVLIEKSDINKEKKEKEMENQHRSSNSMFIFITFLIDNLFFLFFF